MHDDDRGAAIHRLGSVRSSLGLYGFLGLLGSNFWLNIQGWA